jgi:NADPH2 dehydrogenase
VRRWRHFGESGAKLIWGGEAVAVRHDARANPNQLLLTEENASAVEQLRRALVSAHEQRFGSSPDLLIGLQLTHSGRFGRPNRTDLQDPRILYHHPLLDPNVESGPAILASRILKSSKSSRTLSGRRSSPTGPDSR